MGFGDRTAGTEYAPGLPMRYSAEGLVPASSSDTRSQVCRVEMLQSPGVAGEPPLK